MCNDGIFNTGSHDGFGAIFQSPSGTIQNESCVNYDLHPRRHLYSVGIEEGTPSPVFGASFADGTVCANGERLARRGLVFSKWEKTVFVIDFNEEEIRYYNAHKKGHDTAVQEGEPIGRIKFNASSDESKVGVKSLNRKYKGRNNVLVLESGNLDAAKKKITMSLETQLNMFEWKHRLSPISTERPQSRRFSPFRV